MSEKKSMRTEPPKGRPMLQWVGKKPLDVVQPFPAQVVAAHPAGAPSALTWDALQEDNWRNLLFHGDNKEILFTLLANGFRGRIDMVYIDPPFNTGAPSYVRKVGLRGKLNDQYRRAKVEINESSAIEQVQYQNSFVADDYLQKMYERLVLLRELLCESGSIFFRIDYHHGHHIRAIMDEIFGQDAFRNEIIVSRTKTLKGESGKFHTATDTILFYAKSSANLFNGYRVLLPEKEWKWVEMHMVGTRKNEDLLTIEIQGRKFKAPKGRRWMLSQVAIDKADRNELIKIDEKKGIPLFLNKYYAPGSNWTDIRGYSKTHNYPTENSESVLERVIECSTSPNALVLDCFCGSGTTAAVAEKLGRRWIVADINRGAIQTTWMRLEKILAKRQAVGGGTEQTILTEKPHGFAHYRVNNYDFQDEATWLGVVLQKYGIERIPSDRFFDGTRNEELVKISAYNRSMTLLDFQHIQDELSLRHDEQRNILLIGKGTDMALLEEVERHNRLSPINKIRIEDVLNDSVFSFSPAQAEVDFEKENTQVKVSIKDYLSPTILRRLDIDRSVFDEEIKDFRAQIDCVLVDTDYDGQCFNVAYSDIPEKKQGLIGGEYTLPLPRSEAIVAVKIVDMLGEEVLVTSE
ncbi:MAG: site-specific DNA-methyltransferase [Alphaproteobacteria bacterium]